MIEPDHPHQRPPCQPHRTVGFRSIGRRRLAGFRVWGCRLYGTGFLRRSSRDWSTPAEPAWPRRNPADRFEAARLTARNSKASVSVERGHDRDQPLVADQRDRRRREVAVMASSSVWWARNSWPLAIAPLAIRCKARLRSSGVAINRAFLNRSCSDPGGRLLSTRHGLFHHHERDQVGVVGERHVDAGPKP